VGPQTWSAALAMHAAGDLEDAELAAAYVVTRVAVRAGSRLLQGGRRPALRTAGKGPFLDLLATTRIRGVTVPVANALEAWARGEVPVHLLFDVPAPMDVLAWQAKGERCVSLLPEGAKTAPHEDGLAFALHDLCHLDKFVDPHHHAGQVGFFRLVHRAMSCAEWSSFESRFDQAFVSDLEHVVADMNGSAVFLFAALKMKLKMAVRRRIARSLGREERVSGPLDEGEALAYAGELAALFSLMALSGGLGDVATRVNTRRDEEWAANQVLRHFESVGTEAR
jgi:hypothetical protein